MKNDLPLRTRLANATLRRIFRLASLEKALLKLYERFPWRSLLKLMPAHYTFPLGTWRKCRRGGIWFEVDIGTRNGWMLYVHRSKNSEMARFARPGDTVFDIGANQGELTLYYARAVQPSGKVYAFEPSPTMFDNLARNLALNPAFNCQAEPLAVGSAPGRVEMRQPDGRNPGTATIHNDRVPYGGNWTTVDVVRLDDYVRARDIPQIDVIKIDVEGYEFEVCKGAEKIVSRWLPRLVMEMADALLRMHGSSATQLAGWLRERGYRIRNLETGIEIGAGDSLDGCVLNIYCWAGTDRSPASAS